VFLDQNELRPLIRTGDKDLLVEKNLEKIESQVECSLITFL